MSRLLGPFTMSIAPAATASNVVSASLLEFASEVTVFGPTPAASSGSVTLQGSPDLALPESEFRDLESLTTPIGLTDTIGEGIPVIPPADGYRAFTTIAQGAGGSAEFLILARVPDAVATITGSVEVVTGSVIIAGQTADLTINDPVAVTGSVEVLAANFTQSVDIAAGDSISIEGTQSVVVTGDTALPGGAGLSPGGVPLISFADLGSGSGA